MDDQDKFEMPSRSNLKPIVTYVEAWESRIFKSTLVSQLNGNPTLSNDWLTQIRLVYYIW